jgi:hypothetical protein
MTDIFRIILYQIKVGKYCFTIKELLKKIWHPDTDTNAFISVLYSYPDRPYWWINHTDNSN